jgi:hypothetical protein
MLADFFWLDLEVVSKLEYQRGKNMGEKETVRLTEGAAR